MIATLVPPLTANPLETKTQKYFVGSCRYFTDALHYYHTIIE